MNATDISLIFLGVLIVMVLLEVRKLSRKPEPVSRLEAQFERLSQHMERMGGPPQDMELPGGAQIVEAGQTFETISEQLERLGESASEIDAAMLGEEGVRKFLDGLQQLRADLQSARELFQRTADGLGQASDGLRNAGVALQRIEGRLENVLVPAARRRERGEPEDRREPGDRDGRSEAADGDDRP